MHLDDHLRRFHAAHRQLITRAIWIEAGRGARAFDRAVAAGHLVRVDRGVAALAGTDITPERRIAAAVLATQQPCLVSHRSGAYVWGAPVAGIDPVDLLSTDRTGWTRRPGVIVHRPTDLTRAHAAIEKGFRVTTPLRSLVDLGAVAPNAVPAALEAMLVRGVVTVPNAERTARLHARRGRPGVPALRAAIEGLPLGRRAPDSVLEPLAARLFARAGVSGWVFHAHVCGFELDFAFERERVDIEVDGWRWHRGAFEADRRRDAILTAAGWAVVRFTWRQVTRQPAWAAGILAATMAQRSRPR